MFRRKAKTEPEAANETDDSKKQPTAIESATETSDVEEVPRKQSEDESKPQSSSWWQTLTSNTGALSLLGSVAQDAMANSDQLQHMDKDALMKTMSDKGGDIPEKEQLIAALAAQQNATGLLSKASALKDKAMKAMNPAERQKMMQEAYDKEVEANGQSKMAKRMQSGPWQGGIGGAGAGAGVGMGLGTVVGALVGGVVSLPTTALGGLVGAGVGGIHGPFVKLDQKKAKEIEAREKAKGKSDEEVAEAIKAEAVEETVGDAAETAADEEAEEPSTPAASTGASFSLPEQGSAKRNLERQQSSGKTPTKATTTSGAGRDPNKPRKKPRKLEVRSGNKSSATVQKSTDKAGKENDASKAG